MIDCEQTARASCTRLAWPVYSSRRFVNMLLVGSSLFAFASFAEAADRSEHAPVPSGQLIDLYGLQDNFATRTTLDLQKVDASGALANLVTAEPLGALRMPSQSETTKPQLIVIDMRSTNVGPPHSADSAGAHTTDTLIFAQANQPRDTSSAASPSQSTGGIADLDVDQLLEQESDGKAGALSATDQVDLALGQRQVYSDLLTLEDRITRAQRPDANAVTRYSTQSDGLDIAQTEVSQEFFFADGASRLRPGLQYISYSPKTGYSVSQNSGGADGSYRINDVSAISGDFWLNSLASANLETALIPTYDLFLTLWPHDTLRIDIDTKREIFDNITSLRGGIVAESEGGSIDFTPTDELRLTVRATDSQYSDSNERQFGEAEAVWRVLNAPTIEVGFRASAFQFSKLLNDGYFNPSNYWSGEAVFRLQSSLTDDLKAEFAASGGAERADPGGYKPLVKSSLQMTYQITSNWSLDGGINYFSSEESSSSGFARTSGNLGLHYRFN